MSSRELIARANAVPFWKILRLREPSRDIQLRCPFHERHEHGDMRKSARYYMDTNKIFCFGLNQRYITRDGLKSFGETIGTTQQVLTDAGFISAQIKQFGRQQLRKYTFRPCYRIRIKSGLVRLRGMSANTYRPVVYATTDHPWVLENGSVTQDLKIKDAVPSNVLRTGRIGKDYDAGVKHGLIYGDGQFRRIRKKTKTRSYVVNLFGERVGYYAKLFEEIRRFPSCEKLHGYQGSGSVVSEENLKVRPSIRKSLLYLSGFLMGWLAADGFRYKKFERLFSTNHEDLDWVEEIAPILGWIVFGKGEDKSDFTNFGRRTRRVRWVSLRRKILWRVEGIEDLSIEDVACAVVPGRGVFTLEGGLLTHNCFTENKVWSPVDLFVEKTGKSWNQVASMLIKKYGDSVEDNAERLKQQITRSEQKSSQPVSFIELEDSFEEPSVRRYIFEMKEVVKDTGMNLFHHTAETAMVLAAFIKETKREV